MTGLNIQEPWASLLLSGEKTVETRQYPLPKKYEKKPMVIVATGEGRAKMIGLISFEYSFKYADEFHWKENAHAHKVKEGDLKYGWKIGKHGWAVDKITKFSKPIPAPSNKGIIYTTNILDKAGLDFLTLMGM